MELCPPAPAKHAPSLIDEDFFASTRWLLVVFMCLVVFLSTHKTRLHFRYSVDAPVDPPPSSPPPPWDIGPSHPVNSKAYCAVQSDRAASLLGWIHHLHPPVARHQRAAAGLWHLKMGTAHGHPGWGESTTSLLIFPGNIQPG